MDEPMLPWKSQLAERFHDGAQRHYSQSEEYLYQSHILKGLINSKMELLTTSTSRLSSPQKYPRYIC